MLEIANLKSLVETAKSFLLERYQRITVLTCRVVAYTSKKYWNYRGSEKRVDDEK